MGRGLGTEADLDLVFPRDFSPGSWGERVIESFFEEKRFLKDFLGEKEKESGWRIERIT